MHLLTVYLWTALQLRRQRRLRKPELHMLTMQVRVQLLLRLLVDMPAGHLGTLERAVMEQLWDSSGPRTVRQIHHALSARRQLAYNTVMTVLHRLAGKSLVTEIRDDRPYLYAPNHGPEELVADLMVDALKQAPGNAGRQAALLQFVKRVAAEDADALRRALA